MGKRGKGGWVFFYTTPPPLFSKEVKIFYLYDL